MGGFLLFWMCSALTDAPITFCTLTMYTVLHKDSLARPSQDEWRYPHAHSSSWIERKGKILKMEPLLFTFVTFQLKTEFRPDH